MTNPRRRLQLTINIEADSYRELLDTAEDFFIELMQREEHDNLRISLKKPHSDCMGIGNLDPNITAASYAKAKREQEENVQKMRADLEGLQLIDTAVE